MLVAHLLLLGRLSWNHEFLLRGFSRWDNGTTVEHQSALIPAVGTRPWRPVPGSAATTNRDGGAWTRSPRQERELWNEHTHTHTCENWFNKIFLPAQLSQFFWDFFIALHRWIHGLEARPPRRMTRSMISCFIRSQTTGMRSTTSQQGDPLGGHGVS